MNPRLSANEKLQVGNYPYCLTALDNILLSAGTISTEGPECVADNHKPSALHR